LAVLNADKLVDLALRQCGVRGETMGERLKNDASKFSDINGLWTAHKLRNRIAHESDVVVNYDEARHALGYFKKALKDLGAI
jgi:transposase